MNAFKITSLLAFLIIAISGCKKENITDPNQIRLGTWYDMNHTIQIPIKNLNGKGQFFNVLEYSDNTGRHLKLTSINEEGVTTIVLYMVQNVYFNSMVLVGEDGAIYQMYI